MTCIGSFSRATPIGALAVLLLFGAVVGSAQETEEAASLSGTWLLDERLSDDPVEKVKELTADAKEHDITIAVMGCRVNGPGETDDADLGLWCGANSVNFKRKDQLIGAFGYDEVLGKLQDEIQKLIAARAPS